MFVIVTEVTNEVIILMSYQVKTVIIFYDK